MYMMCMYMHVYTRVHVHVHHAFTCSYRDNPTLGDPNTLIEELLEMRNKIRVKEAELVMIRAKVRGQKS